MVVMLMRFEAKLYDVGETETGPGRVDVAVLLIPGRRIVLRRESWDLRRLPATTADRVPVPGSVHCR